MNEKSGYSGHPADGLLVLSFSLLGDFGEEEGDETSEGDSWL